MTACLFGTYVRSHSANRLLRAALAGAGFTVVECHEPLWEETPAKPAAYFGAASLAALGARYAAVATRLARRWRAVVAEAGGAPPLVVAGFGGQLDVLLARRVCRPCAGLVFAPLVSLTETLVLDRRVVAPGGAPARALAALDRATFRAADLVLADTAAHADYLRGLGAPADKVAVWHLGVEPEFLAPVAPAPVPRRVLFYGSFVPLHGVETIVAAAERLAGRAAIELIGHGPERPRLEARAVRAGVTLRDPVPLAALPGELARAAVVLGVFGEGEKAAMVVPNKVYQAAAAGRPLVTRDGPALREVLHPDEDCVVCPPADPAALAAAVAGLLDDPARAARLGAAARAAVVTRFAPERQAERLAALLAERLDVRVAPRAVAPTSRTAAVVVTWEGGVVTDRCVGSLLAQDAPAAEVIVVDNASGAAERERLRVAWGARPGVRLLLLDDNRQFAGGLNAGARAALAAGAERVLLLNNDTVLAPDALRRLGAALDATPGAGVAGPSVHDLRAPARVLSAGERHVLPLLCVPRTLLRHRRAAARAYAVSGVMGCALLVTRACFEAVGGWASDLEVYYEDVDFSLGARARGFELVIEPRAVVWHDGLRGFAAGLTPWAAFLKARNPWLLVRRRGGPGTWLTFLPTYAAMVATSAALYALRGRTDVSRALGRGALAGLRVAAGAAPVPVGAPERPSA